MQFIWNGMGKYFITYCDYPKGHPVRVLYEEKTKPRFVEYCNVHGFQFTEISKNIAHPYNLGFSKVFWIKQNMHKFQDGDVITYMDIDCCIVDGRVPAVFDADFSIVRETCGLLCMGGTWSVRISDWSRKFIKEFCSLYRQALSKDTELWKTWHENGAVYDVLGLDWDADPITMGTKPTTHFTQKELLQHVNILPVNWGVTYNPEDVVFTQPLIFGSGSKRRRNPNRTYQIISTCAKQDRICNSDEIIVRHLSAGTMLQPWASKYFNKKMIL
jgi:hypothetical protein